MEVHVVVKDTGVIRSTMITSSRMINGKRRNLITCSTKLIPLGGVVYGTKGIGVNRVKGVV